MISLLIGQIYFVNDGAQNYLTLQPLYYTLKKLANTKKCMSRKSKGLSTKYIEWYKQLNGTETQIFRLVFKKNCLKQKWETFFPPNIIFFFSELDTWPQDLNANFTL